MAFSGMVKSYQGKSISSDVLSAKMLSMILASNRYSNDKTQETILSIADEENELRTKNRFIIQKLKR